jgi:signal transduction histidine kinase/DNA-binding response OmpR family regulator
MLQVGGLTTSLGFVFIGLNVAMGSVLAGNLRWTIGLFLLYGVTIMLLGFLQPYLVTPDYITPEINTLFFVLDALWVNACILFLTVFFMKDQSRLEKAETDRIKKLEEAKTLLYTNISHEFRTPLTIIEGIAEQMDKHSEKWLRTGPGKIKAQSQSLLRLVNQMLDIAKIESEGMVLNPIQGDINKFVQYIANYFYSLAEQRGIELQISANADQIYADYDPDKLMKILTNLISNAIKFTPLGGHIIVGVSNVAEEGQEKVNIYVSDSGMGIAPEHIGHIFDRFYQVPNQLVQTPGTGLGLALTRELVILMKGDIRIKSEVSRGTEFIVSLPVTRIAQLVEDHGISLVHPDTFHSPIPMSDSEKDLEISRTISPEKPILLLVEDNHNLVEYLLAILGEYYMVELASNGKAGLEKALEIIPDIILTDVMMPQMDGFELLTHLKNDILTDHIPVVVLTAMGDFQSKLTGLEKGADHYLVKPFSEQELLLKLNNLLDSRRKMQQKLGTMPMTAHSGNSKYRQELQFMSRIKALLDEHLQNEDFGVMDICSSLSISRPQLYRKFTALTDKSIGRYIRSYRLHKAKAMMESQGKNVTEAALDSGFKNLSHFSTIFREEFGYPPSDLL